MSAPRNLAVFRLSALGDVVHTLPAVAALRRGLPGTRIGWVVERPFAELVRSCAAVDEVFVVETRRWRRRWLRPESLKEISEALRDVRRFVEHDTAVDFQALYKSALLARVSGARVRWGFSQEDARERGAAALFNHRVSVGEIEHVVDKNLALAVAAGGAAEKVEFGLERFLPESPGESLLAAMADHPVVLLAGAGRKEKLWPVEHFTELAKRLAAEGLKVLTVWGPAERERAEAIAASSPAALAPPTNLRELAFVLAKGRLVIGGDTGPLHIAAALATPVVGLYGPSDLRRNGPYGQERHCIESHSSNGRMDSIEPSAVVARVLEVLR